ncbi:hypothetical protein BRADI_1g20801v3 [Brachypodium distachyon]|uniref:NAC domain-containing protein n=2 Tax=Brachypodium distachyon TaxID=15368 RepID=A0A0Q3KVA0_BRADI|nr:hypothetical protein BRADI_1g20801v3 [Brachypodium distachyon]
MGDHLHQQQLDLAPGFRFHPTDEELIRFYLNPKVKDKSFCTTAIGEVDMNKYDPWEFPTKANMVGQENKWYFYCQKDRKYPTGRMTNRTTKAGYWKGSGKDKEIYHGHGLLVGMKKTLIFYRGRAPNGEKTNWVMHEYRTIETTSDNKMPSNSKSEWVVCRIYHKSSGIKKEEVPSYPMDPINNEHISMPMSMPMGNQQDGFDSETAISTIQLPPLMDHFSMYQLDGSVGSSTSGNNQAPMPFYQQHMQMPITADEGYMVAPVSGPSSMMSQDDTEAATADEFPFVFQRGMEGMWIN